jgi:hypothetical protein
MAPVSLQCLSGALMPAYARRPIFREMSGAEAKRSWKISFSWKICTRITCFSSKIFNEAGGETRWTGRVSVSPENKPQDGQVSVSPENKPQDGQVSVSVKRRVSWLGLIQPDERGRGAAGVRRVVPPPIAFDRGRT